MHWLASACKDKPIVRLAAAKKLIRPITAPIDNNNWGNGLDS